MSQFYVLIANRWQSPGICIGEREQNLMTCGKTILNLIFSIDYEFHFLIFFHPELFLQIYTVGHWPLNGLEGKDNASKY